MVLCQKSKKKKLETKNIGDSTKEVSTYSELYAYSHIKANFVVKVLTDIVLIFVYRTRA